VDTVTYDGDGATTVFPVPFRFLENGHLEVVRLVGSTQTTLALNVDYTVTGAGAATGTVTFLAAPGFTDQIIIRRNIPIIQETDLRNQGSYTPDVQEDALDYRTMVEQQLSRRVADIEQGVTGAPSPIGDGLEVSGGSTRVKQSTGISVGASGVAVIYGGAPLNVASVTAAAGTANSASRSDHKHSVKAAAPAAGSVLIGNAAAQGSSDSLALADHVHPVPAPAAPADVTKAAASAGVSTNFARADHKHDVSTAAVVTLTDSTNAEGTATSLARSDHTHSHGARGGGTLHSVATSGSAGFMAAGDKASLDGNASAASKTTVQTTDPTATVIQTYRPSDGSVVLIEADIVGLQDTGALGAGYKIVGTFRRSGGTTAQVGVTTVLVTHEDDAAWTVDFNVSSPDVRVRVTGKAGQTINWACFAKYHIAP